MKNQIKLIFLTLACTLGITACKKEKIHQSTQIVNGQNLTLKSGALPTSSEYGNPDVSNNMLFFDNKAHLEDYYDAIDTFLHDLDSNEQETLDLIEAQYGGYESYRTNFNTANNWLNGSFTSQQIEDISRADLFKDEILKTLMSKDRMIGIDDTVYYHHAENISFKIHKDCTAIISDMRALIQDEEIFRNGKVFKMEDSFDMISALFQAYEPKATATYSNCIIYHTQIWTADVVCSTNERKIRVQVNEQYCTGANGSSAMNYDINLGETLVIDWGDLHITTHPNYSGEWITHSYPYGVHGQYSPKTTINFVDVNGVTQSLEDGAGTNGQDFGISVGSACTDANASDYDWEESGDYKLTAQIWIDNDATFNNVGAKSTAWKKNSAGLWEMIKASLYAEISADVRNSSCHFKNNRYGDKQRNNRKSITEIELKLFNHYNFFTGDVNSSHEMNKNGVTIQFDMELNPC